MNFVLGKELRVLSVVEFIFFFVSLLKCQVTSSGDVEMFFGNKPATVLQLLKKACLTWDVILSGFEMALYISVLVLLYKDVQVCNDRTVKTVLILAFVCLALRFVSATLTSILSMIPEKEMDENEVQTLTDKSIKCFSKVNLDSIAEKLQSVLKKPLFLALTVLFTVGLLLFFGAVGIFFFATTIKLAIPGEYEAACNENSNISRIIMLVLPCIRIVVYINDIIFTILRHFSQRKLPILFASLSIPLLVGIPVRVLTQVLFIRLIKVWNDEDLQLYEYIGLAIAFPLVADLLSAGSSSEEEETQEQGPAPVSTLGPAVV